jgi:anti-anti-sigma factor
MQITTQDHGDLLEMRIDGRLDNEWAGHLTDILEAAIRQGSHSVVLDLTDVSYLSSAGIGSLVRAYKQFQSIRGFFGVGVAPPHIAEVIRLTGLAKMLLCDIEAVRRSSGSSRATIEPTFRVSAETGMAFELYDVEPGATMSCEVVGHPERLPQQAYRAEDCEAVQFPANALGLGLGAFGRDFGDCADRFGEFLAAAGSVAQLPTKGTGRPDFQFGTGSFVPTVQMGYGIRCLGEFAQLHRFEPADSDGRAPISDLVDQCLTLSKTDLAGMVFVAESAGLIGAALRSSPASDIESSTQKFTHPEIRRWLSFSPERAFSHSLAFVVGVASRGVPSGSAEKLAPLLRSLGPRSNLHGHFHAAVFSFRPFKKRMLDLSETIAALFESEQLQAVLHLLHDDREITGGGESEFVRGACWIAPISNVTGDRQT